MISQVLGGKKIKVYLAGENHCQKAKSGQGIFFGLFVFLMMMGLLAPSLGVLATSSPRFNIFTPYTCSWVYNRDYYLICVKNDTKSTSYNTSVSADPGDILTFSVYYHNGVNNTTAYNTRLRVSLPTNQSTSHSVAAYLWADNAQNATASNPLTFSNTITLSSSQTLEYIQNSAKWYPDQRSPLSDSPVSFPSGQSGNELISGGVNLGSITGCWEFSGLVNFQVKVGQQVQIKDFTIDKKVRNVTAGEIDFADSTTAFPRQIIEFSITITSTGNVAATNVGLRDQLPDRLIYVAGSTTVNGSYALDGIVSGGITLGDVNPGQSKVVKFRVNVEREAKFVRGQTILTNTAYAQMDASLSPASPEKSDTAQVIVSYTGCNPENNSPAQR